MVYLSTSDDISISDTLLSTQNYNWTFVPMQNVNINMGSVTIPANTPGPARQTRGLARLGPRP